MVTEQQFYEQFTMEEKSKLYDAIGYQENEADPTLPKTVSVFLFSSFFKCYFRNDSF